MKKLILLAFFVAAAAMKVSAQSIVANKAAHHVGEHVVVIDNVRNVTFYNDSTAVLDLGGKGNNAPLNVVFKFNPKFKMNSQMFKSCKEGKLEVYGNVISVLNQPTIVITDQENVHFLSDANNNKWLGLSQTAALNK